MNERAAKYMLWCVLRYQYQQQIIYNQEKPAQAMSITRAKIKDLIDEIPFMKDDYTGE